jgi:Protein of unknown function (DUF2934)
MSVDLVTEQTQHSADEEVAIRAYRRWEERGCPIGSPEEDWFRAEEEIRSEQAAHYEAVRARNRAVREREHFIASGDASLPPFSDHSGAL